MRMKNVYLLSLCLLKLLFPFVYESIQHCFDIPDQIHHDGVFVTLGDEKYLADVSQTGNHLLLKLLCALRLTFVYSEF